MVQVQVGDLVHKVHRFYPGKRMPFLCCFNRSSGWRILSENYEEHIKGLRSEHYDINQDGGSENYLTCMSISDDGIVAIGSGNKDGSLYFTRDLSDIKDVESGSRFKPLHRQVLGAPIHSLDWSGSHLLVGTHQGISKLFKIAFDGDQLQQFELIGQYVNSPSDITFYAPSYTTNTHVKSAEFSSTYSSQQVDGGNAAQSQFLTTTLNQLSVWDALEQKAPVSRICPNESPLTCASWNPGISQSLVVCGGYDRKLTIVDTRVSTNEHNGIVWSADNAHDRPIRDAKFNPFIPYWLASGGEDSIVNIWDIRGSYHAPVAKIDGNGGIVTSVTWSNIRPENLGTTASDGTMRYYTLTPDAVPMWDTMYRIQEFDYQDTLPIVREPQQDNIWCIKDKNYKYSDAPWWKTDLWDEMKENEDEEDEGKIKRSTMLLAGALGLGEWGRPEPGTVYKGEELVRGRGSVVSVMASKLRPSMYYSITSGGQLTAHIVRFDAASNLRGRHRFDPADKDALAAEIEDDIYCRRITDAQRKLEELKAAPKQDERAEKERAEEVEFLQDCLTLRPPIKDTEWAFDSIPNKSSQRASRRLWNDTELWEEVIQAFKKDLSYWSYRIPPGYNTKYKFPLEFKAPIIAPHLLEEEKVLSPLPPMTEESSVSYLEVPEDIAASPYIYDSDIEDNANQDEPNQEKSLPALPAQTMSPQFKPADDPPQKLGIKMTSFDQTEDTTSAPIKDRRNMGHVPPIVTVHEDSTQEDQHSKNPFTPPHSAPAMQPIASKNPFDSGAAPEPSPVKTPRSTNPFEMTPLDRQEELLYEKHHSSNPFENDTEDDKLSVQSAHSQKSEEHHHHRHSWIPGTHRLHLSLSNHSAHSFSGGDESGLKTPTSKKHHKFNPFKRILSSRGEEKESITLQPEPSPENILKKQASIRRNAMHGPF